tara:strand:+ start:1649 stop:1756 length:108 start_codon:yes stop_codon:yes gene_type:complete
MCSISEYSQKLNIFDELNNFFVSLWDIGGQNEDRI